MLVYGAYAAAAIGALAVFVAMPQDRQARHRGVVLTLMAFAAGAFILLLGRLLGENEQRFFSYVLAVLAIGGAVRVVTHTRPVYSALFFVLVVLSTAGLMVLVGAEFLAAALVVVYAGAILVTYVFVIMMAQQNPPTAGGQFATAWHHDRNSREPAASVLAGFVLVATIAGVIVSRPDHGSAEFSEVAAGGNVAAVGRVLLLDYALSVELAGVLLMVAMVGAIAIARKRLPPMEGEPEPPTPGEIGKHVKPF